MSYHWCRDMGVRRQRKYQKEWWLCRQTHLLTKGLQAMEQCEVGLDRMLGMISKVAKIRYNIECTLTCMNEYVELVVRIISQLSLTCTPHDGGFGIECSEPLCAPSDSSTVPVLILGKVKRVGGKNTRLINVAAVDEAHLRGWCTSPCIYVAALSIFVCSHIAISRRVGWIPPEAVGTEALNNFGSAIVELHLGDAGAFESRTVCIL